MRDEDRKVRSLKRFRGAEREAVRIANDRIVTLNPPPGGHSLPLMVCANFDGVNLAAWAQGNEQLIHELLARHGAILFRNFDVSGLLDLAQFVRTISGDLLEYRERSSPRTHVMHNIYTSTEYPAHQAIFLHNENSYAHTWPLKLFFLCSVPPLQDGETPIADCRQIFNSISPKIRDRFIQKSIMYVRNFSEELGLSWQTAFGTTARAAVVSQCHEAGYEVQWTGANGLRTKRVGQAVARHPRTGEITWFNHATFFHVSTLEPELRDALLAQFGEEDLPNNTYYGDGSPIEASVLDELRQAYKRAKVSLPWQAADILMLDNLLTAHGREPYVGPRQIRVAMSEPCTEQPI
ncbi:MAG: TauD/TfdA family dioxygenase [Pyrinomonadaceae bacterium]